MAAIAAVLLVVGVGAGASLDRSLGDENRRERAARIALIDTGLTTRVTDLQSRIDRIQQLATDSRRELRTVGLDELLRTTAISAVGTVDELAGRLVSGTAGGSAPIPGSPAAVALATPGALGAAQRSRDLGAPRSVLARDQQGTQLVIFWPRYAAASGPVTTHERRDLFTEWLVGLVRPEAAIAAPLGAAHGIGLAPRLKLVNSADANLVPGAGPALTPEGDAIAAGLVWRLDYPPASSDLSGAFWVVVGLSGLGAFAVMGVGWFFDRRARRVARGYSDVQAQVVMLADLGASLQESLDLGSVLPGVLSRLSAELALDYIAVAVRDDAGHFEELFALGHADPAATLDWLPSGEATGVGATPPARALTAIPLRRDLRTIGRLSFRPIGESDQNALAALASAADLIAGAVGNAALFEREQETVRRLRELDALKDSFLGTVSHELRTPLTVLTGFTSLLTERWDQLAESDRRDAVGRMQTHALWLTSLINDILDFVTDGRETSPVLLTELDLGPTVGQYLDELGPLLANHVVTATLEPGVFVRSDATAVQRILANLVSNAVKFAPPGSEIAVRVSRVDTWGLVAVSDQGPGISAEDQEHIFRRFYRGKSEAAQGTRGVGIGLAVVADWVRQIGGQIAVESAVGTGTTMILRLPVLEHSNTELTTHV